MMPGWKLGYIRRPPCFAAKSLLRSTQVAGSRHLSGRAFTLCQISASGSVEKLSASPRDLVKNFDILARDCRLLQTSSAHVDVRDDYFIFRFPPFAGAVRYDRALLVSNESPSAAQALKHRLLQPLAADGSSVDGGFGHNRLPFEHRVLEAVLHEDTLHKWDRYMRLQQLIKSTIATFTPQEHSGALLSLLSTSWILNTAREDALYRLLTLSKSLGQLDLDVKSSNDALSTLLASDEDMAALYLSHRAAGASRPIDQHTEVELMLENYATEHDDLSDRISALQDQVNTCRSIEQLKLTNERNRIMRIELLLGFGTASLALCAAVAGFFGMNLHSGVDEVPGLFWAVTGGTSAVGMGLFCGFLFSVRRFHASQQHQIVATAALETGLASLDAAYFMLRRQGILHGEIHSDVNEQAIISRTSLEESLLQLRDEDEREITVEEKAALWAILDADGNGVLTEEERHLQGDVARAAQQYHSDLHTRRLGGRSRLSKAAPPRRGAPV